MTFDNKGRMITSDQYGKLYRIDLPKIGYDTTKDSVVVRELPIKLTDSVYSKREHIGFAHGLLYAFNSLYVVVNDEGAPDSVSLTSGLYRLQDTNNDDVYEKISHLKKLDGPGEHGPHNVVVGPDSSSLYLIAGNFTKIPEVNNYLIPATWKTDNLLPLLPDPRGFGVKLDPPGGWIDACPRMGITGRYSALVFETLLTWLSMKTANFLLTTLTWNGTLAFPGTDLPEYAM